MEKLEFAKQAIEYQGFQVSGIIRAGEWEGDPSISRGIHYLPPYVEDLTVMIDDVEHTDNLTSAFLEECGRALVEEVLGSEAWDYE